MAKPGRLPDFRKMYPEASEEVIEVLRETERKMQYQEYDLKAEQTIIDQEAQQIRFIPGREDSYERLVEHEVQFLADGEDTEAQVIRKLQYEMLHKAISCLSEEEERLIRLLFFEECTEREVAESMGIYHNAVHKQKKRILQKLKNILKNFHLCGWIFQLIALVSFDKGIIMPFDRMICSQKNTCTIRIITL